MVEKIKRKKIFSVIEIPENIKVDVEGRGIKISKNNEEIKRKLGYNVKIDGGKIILECEKPTKRDKKLINTTISHIKNMISGLQEKYVYKLQICSVHFPVNVSVSGKEVVIKNFLGESKARRAKILEGVEVKVENDIIKVESIDKEKAGQTAANIETATKIKNRDRRIFQDGIYIIEKRKGRKERK